MIFGPGFEQPLLLDMYSVIASTVSCVIKQLGRLALSPLSSCHSGMAHFYEFNFLFAVTDMGKLHCGRLEMSLFFDSRTGYKVQHICSTYKGFFLDTRSWLYDASVLPGVDFDPLTSSEQNSANPDRQTVLGSQPYCVYHKMPCLKRVESTIES